MRRMHHLAAAVLVAALAAALAREGLSGPPGPRAKPTLPPVTSRPAAERDALLDRIEQRAKNVTDITANFLQQVHRPIFDERDTRTGSLMMLKPQYLRVHWKTPAPAEEIAYDGDFFWEVKHGTRQVIQWTVARKQPAGEGKPKLDAGPFRFLAGIKAEDVKKDYLVALVDDKSETAPHRLLLVPLKPQDQMEYLALEVWVDRGDLLPRRIHFTKPRKEVETWTLKDLKVNPGLTTREFQVPVPRGWRLIKDPA